MVRYDARAPSMVDDPSRGDLAREVKQVLTYATVTRALTIQQAKERRFEWLSSAVNHAVNTLLKPVGFTFTGVDTLSLEPMFSDGIKEVPFDSLPTRVRNLVAFAALPVRALWAAYPFRDPLESEGIVTIDEVDLYQDPMFLAHLMPTLNQALPRVQWIVTATSPSVAAGCDASEVIALRRSPDVGTIEYFNGPMALTH
jgi:predicted ATP-binding protein involved in virulence